MKYFETKSHATVQELFRAQFITGEPSNKTTAWKNIKRYEYKISHFNFPSVMIKFSGNVVESGGISRIVFDSILIRKITRMENKMDTIFYIKLKNNELI